jgi:hypothetical protein
VVGGKRHASAALALGKRQGIRRTEGWVGPRAGMDGRGKSRSQPEFDPQTAQPVVSRYTDWAIPPHLQYNVCCTSRKCNYINGIIYEYTGIYREHYTVLQLIQILRYYTGLRGMEICNCKRIVLKKYSGLHFRPFVTQHKIMLQKPGRSEISLPHMICTHILPKMCQK